MSAEGECLLRQRKQLSDLWRTLLFIVSKPMRLTACAKVSGNLFLVALIFFGPGSKASADIIDVGQFVEAAGGDVSSVAIIIERLPDGQVWSSNAERALRQVSPASTSKIPHTLIALERGLATLETVYVWDGVPRSVQAWNRNHTLESAFQKSVVWVYQEIARTSGHVTMSEALADLDYGNMNIGSIDHLTTYWLDDTLRISVAEQVAFLSRLTREQLPLSANTYAVAKDIMISDADANWVMRSKTGWRHSDSDMDIGWFVGWLECANESYVFALNMDMPDTRYLSKRKDIGYSVLEAIGAFDCR